MQNIELEAELRPSAAAQPAKWPYEPSTSCTGNCTHGRADVEEEPMTRTEARWLVVIYVFSTVAVVSAIAAVIQ